jgi:serine protease AprX
MKDKGKGMNRLLPSSSFIPYPSSLRTGRRATELRRLRGINMSNQQGSRKLPLSPVDRVERWWRFSTVAVVALSLAIAFIVLLQATARGDSVTQKSDLFLSRKAGLAMKSGWTSVIVKFKGGLTRAHDLQVGALGGYVYRHLPVIGSAAVRIPNRNFARLAAMPNVERLSSDLSVKKTDEFTVASSGADTAFGEFGLTGNGVAVAVLDSGVNPTSPDLSDKGEGYTRVIWSVTFVPGGLNDLCGHGTHVAGIIAGNGTASTGPQYSRTFYGIARRARIVNVRVLDKYGMGKVSDVVSGIQWVINNRAKLGIRVINLSVGHEVGESYNTDPLCRAVESAWKSGIVVVCAAGNQGRRQATPDSNLSNEGYGAAYGSIQSPGNDPYVITVGAMKSTDGVRTNDRIATYSSRGPSRIDNVMKPDIVAPGNRVISLKSGNAYLANAFPDNQVPLTEYMTNPGSTTSPQYFRLSGTSMAAPVVSGAVALMLERDPTLTPDTVKARLMVSADKWSFADGTTDACTFGAGYLNIPGALACTVTAGSYAVTPTLSCDKKGNVLINVNTAIWGVNAIWGSGIPDYKAIWGENAIWGSNTLSSSLALWGQSVWVDNAVWGVSTNSADLSSTALNGD